MIPKSLPAELRNELMQFASPKEWFLAQPGIEDLLEQKKRKLDKRHKEQAERLCKDERLAKSLTTLTSIHLKDTSSSRSKNFTKIPQHVKTLSEHRVELLQHIADQLLRRKDVLSIPKKTHPDLLAEVYSHQKIKDWANAQPGFPALFKRMSKRLIKHRTEQEDTVPPIQLLSPQRSLEIATKRIEIVNDDYNNLDLNRLQNALGILPPSPRLKLGSGKISMNERLCKANLWTRTLHKIQMEHWRSLFKREQNEYLIYGRVSLGTVVQKMKSSHKTITPLSDVTTSLILRQIERASDEKLDPKKIDWDAT